MRARCAAFGATHAKSDQVRALSFDQALVKGGEALAAGKEILGVYGISIDQWLDSVSAETLSEDGNHASVRVKFEVLGLSEEADLEMEYVDGHWKAIKPKQE